MGRDIEHIAAWFVKVYENNTAGLIECWQKVLLITRENTQEGFQLSQGEHYKLPLPASLSTSSLTPTALFITVPVQSYLTVWIQGQLRN
jgi:hypothetical protein